MTELKTYSKRGPEIFAMKWEGQPLEAVLDQLILPDAESYIHEDKLVIETEDRLLTLKQGDIIYIDHDNMLGVLDEKTFTDEYQRGGYADILAILANVVEQLGSVPSDTKALLQELVDSGNVGE